MNKKFLELDEWDDIFEKEFNDDINIKRGLANLLKADDPNILKKIAKKTTETWQDPNHRAKMEKVHADRSQSDWYDKIRKANKWENRSDEAKRNALESRKALPTNPNYIEGMKRRQASDWHEKNALAHKDKNKNPKNIRQCDHCQKFMPVNVYDRHLKSCLFVNGPITTFKGDEPQYVYETEQALIDDGFDLMRIKQIINTDKYHAGYLFKS